PVSLQQVDDRLDAGDDAERAVERTTATDRVDVGAGDDRATAARPFDPAPDVADRVAASEETAVPHPPVHELGARDPGRAVERAVEAATRQGAALSELEEGALEPATRQGAARSELVEPAEEPPLIDLHQLERLHRFTRCTNQPSPGSPSTFPSRNTVRPRTIVRATAP